MPALLTPELAERALDLVAPAIDALLNRDQTWIKRSALFVVIMKNDPDEEHTVVVALRNFGSMTPVQWPHPFNQIAMGKARLALRTGMDTASVIALHPELLKKGDAKYRGGVVTTDIGVAASGIQSYWDQMVARWVMDAIEALMLREVEEGNGNFI